MPRSLFMQTLVGAFQNMQGTKYDGSKIGHTKKMKVKSPYIIGSMAEHASKSSVPKMRTMIPQQLSGQLAMPSINFNPAIHLKT